MSTKITVPDMEISQSAIDWVKKTYIEKFGSAEDFNENYQLALDLDDFKASENIHEKMTNYKVSADELIDVENEYLKGESFDPKVHWILRMLATYYMHQVFHCMKVDQTDPNIAINSLGKGTPGRIVKMWMGSDPEDTSELLSGRWNKEPALSVFPNDGSTTGGEKITYPVTKQVDVVAVCSHHFLPFSSLEPNARVKITYIPKDILIGISKLQRFTNWASRRGWLQEDLCSYIGTTIKRISGSEDVMIEMVELVHGCERYRGAAAKNGNLTTIYKSGVFKGNQPESKKTILLD